MLSFVVYIEAHPRRDATLSASSTSINSPNSFASYSFRTLASHLKATVSSNSFGINRFRTLCKIPGIGHPPRQSPPFHDLLYLLKAISVIQILYFQWLPDSCITMDARNPFSFNRFRTLSIAMGVYTPYFYSAKLSVAPP
jgi:hypothetical protein